MSVFAGWRGDRHAGACLAMRGRVTVKVCPPQPQVPVVSCLTPGTSCPWGLSFPISGRQPQPGWCGGPFRAEGPTVLPLGRLLLPSGFVGLSVEVASGVRGCDRGGTTHPQAHGRVLYCAVN